MDSDTRGRVFAAFEDLFEKLDEIGMEVYTDDGDGNNEHLISRTEWLEDMRAFFRNGLDMYDSWTQDSWEGD